MMSGANILLGINVDHVATLRQARGTEYPSPVEAALLAERSGADSITVHLREDRRHIQDHDIEALGELLQTRMNLEMAVTDEMIQFASKVRPSDCCLVPENRAELTTEGGLDLQAHTGRIRDACAELAAQGIRVSLFIDPESGQLESSREVGAPVVELHTGCYADAKTPEEQARELERIKAAAAYGAELGLIVHAGHGLHYKNVRPVAAIAQVRELNIGHSIIARAVIDGLANAVIEMKRLIIEGRSA
jgi:pyridoxine 5-phosphate synthase